MKVLRIYAYAVLGRIWISLAAGLSAATGHLLAAYSPEPGALLTGTSVFLLACGASALNQCQERKTDLLMERTKTRPLPSGSIIIRHAIFFTVSCFASGLAGLYLSGGFPALFVGLAAVAWYNGLYTFLKKKTAYAFLPGALVGAVPPALGWIAGHGSYSPPIFALGIFFFFWQVPHFWLYAARYQDEYRRAGLPAISSLFSEQQIRRIIFIWIVALSVSSLFLVLSGLALQFPVRYLMVAAAAWLMAEGSRLLGSWPLRRVNKRILGSVNIYLIVVIVLLAADRIAYLFG